MLDWLIDNWQYITLAIACISLFVNCIVLLRSGVPLKKLIKVIKLVPDLINQAESLFPVSHEYGNIKKQIVIDNFNDLLGTYNIKKYAKYIDIDNLVEDFLNCPEKKKNEVV